VLIEPASLGVHCVVKEASLFCRNQGQLLRAPSLLTGAMKLGDGHDLQPRIPQLQKVDLETLLRTQLCQVQKGHGQIRNWERASHLSTATE